MVNTLPLYQTPTIADAWHNVTSPGGYEWWYFDAEDAANDRQIVAMLGYGHPFDSEYMRQYARFARNPTRVTPPRPSECIFAHFAVYHAGRVERQFTRQYPAELFEVRQEKRHVVIGTNRFTAGNTLQQFELVMGGVPVMQAAHNPPLLETNELYGMLTFTPRFMHSPRERELFSRQLVDGDHRWIVADPVCDVQGDIVILDSPGRVPFHGRGYHDHWFGTRPLGKRIHRSLRGRVLLDDRCVTFHHALAHDGAMETHLIEIDGDDARDVEVRRAEVDWSRKSAAVPHPGSLQFDDVLRLTNPRLLESSTYWCRASYDATLRGKPSGQALCEIAHPPRC
jgi:carotenoid 1,2-hydratase